MKLLYNSKYRDLMVKQVKEQLLFLLQNSIEFSIVVHMDSGVDFNPPLPEEISNTFKEYTLFAIGGYTFKSAFVENNTFIFEAGFGPENIGSRVYVDIDRILQIVIGENIIFINVTASVEKESVKDSFEVFLNNPRNKKFFKN
ncbi:MAG: hypothetical protein DSY40_00145 [Nautilia sp.]|nr:MAG: hypothetical protein DSY40_00145 [Nautilia sp.]